MKDVNLSNWIGGLTLEERVAIADFTTKGKLTKQDTSPCWLFNEWKSIKPFAESSNLFESKLTALKINEIQFSLILKNEVKLNISAAPLDWAIEIENLYSKNNQAELLNETVQNYPALHKLEFLKLALPIIVKRITELEQHFSPLIESQGDIYDLSQTINVFLARLTSQMAKVISRTLVLEMHCAKQQGLLKGQKPKQRYQDFINLLSNPQYTYHLLLEYPVLARKLVTISQQWADTFTEFVERLVADYPKLREVFSSSKPLGRFESIGEESGDSHRRGKTVIVVNFSSGTKVVYKPRSISIEQHFQELLTWFNQKSSKLNFKTIETVERKTHGWVEFVSFKPCNSHNQLQSFYFQLGALKAILFSLKATDFHYENFIAHGDKPVAIDLETLFQTNITGHLNSTDSFNVLDIGMLPTTLSDEGNFDFSGMGADQLDRMEQDAWKKLQTDELFLGKATFSNKNILSKPSKESCANDFIENITSGFTTVYQLINDNKIEFTAHNGVLDYFSGDTIRLVFKNTQTYSELLWESYHPSYLRCALQTNKLLDVLWGTVVHNPITEKIVAFEVLDIINNDIPYFESKINNEYIKGTDGNHIDLKLSELSLDAIKTHINIFSDENLSAQLWLISTSLQQKEKINEIDKVIKSNPLLTNNVLTVQYDFLALAEKIGDFLAKIAIQNDRHALWIGQHYQDESNLFSRLDASLYKGQLGIIWFLAYLAKVSKKNKYKQLAKKGIRHCLDNLLAEQLIQPSVGLFDGIGSFIYVLAHLQNLWPEKDFKEYIQKIIAVLPEKITEDKQLDVIGGTAGCLIALQALYKILPDKKILTLCKQCGDKLLDSTTETINGSAWIIASEDMPLAGLSHGVSGISLALTRLSNLLSDDKYLLAARSAIGYEDSLFSDKHNNWLDLREGTDGNVGWAWCNGAPGIAIERIESAKQLYGKDNSGSINDLDSIIKSILSSQWPSDYSLCHGAFGNLDILSYIAEQTKDQQLSKVCKQAISQTIEQWVAPYKSFDYLFKQVPSFGLMIGSTGIGYTLLRQISPEQVPNILAMQAPFIT
jgi:type 2 lantibiotic biosynthesis protein LanM